MHLALRWSGAIIAAGVVSLGCGGDDTGATGGTTGGTTGATTGEATTGGATTGGATTGMATTGGATTGGSTGGGGDMGMIPDPGTDMNAEWTDIEPNDLPSQAVPVGILAGPIWAGFVMPYTAINPADDVDHFVFQTGDAASLANVNLTLCWSFPGNLIDMSLYEVTGGQKGAEIVSATSMNAGCETADTTGVIAANTVYLLEVRGAPGLVLGADEGLYSA